MSAIAMHTNNISTTTSRKTLFQSGLACVFVVSFIPYITTVTTATLLAAPLCLFLYAFVGVPFLSPKLFAKAITALKRRRFLLIAVVTPAFPLVMSLYNGDARSLLYTALITVVLVAVQVTLATVGIRGMIRALALSSIICVPMFVVSALPGIVSSLHGTARLIPASAQPNSIAFIFVGFILAWTWTYFADTYRTRMISCGCVTTACATAIIFLLSSRASILALLLAAAWPVSHYVLRPLRTRHVTRRFVITGLVTTFLLIGYTAVYGNPIQGLVDVFDKVFLLNSQYRGIDTGFSGRTARWSALVYDAIRHGTWFFGNGYYTSTKAIGASVDNGFLAVWYSSGFLGLTIIVGQLFWLFFYSMRRSRMMLASFRDRSMLLLMGSFVIALFTNNIFAHYLFGIGNPFSLFALSLLLCNRNDVNTLSSIRHRCGARKPQTRLQTHPTASSL